MPIYFTFFERSTKTDNNQKIMLEKKTKNMLTIKDLVRGKESWEIRWSAAAGGGGGFDGVGYQRQM
jgi:hypothetical protein